MSPLVCPPVPHKKSMDADEVGPVLPPGDQMSETALDGLQGSLEEDEEVMGRGGVDTGLPVLHGSDDGGRRLAC